MGTHPAVPRLWAVGSGCRLPVIVLASGGKAAILVWREGGSPRAAPHRVLGHLSGGGLRRGDPGSHTPGQSSGGTRAEQPLGRQQEARSPRCTRKAVLQVQTGAAWTLMFSASSPSPNAKALAPPPQAIDVIFGCEVFGHTGPKHSDRQTRQLSEHGRERQHLPHDSLGRRSGRSCLLG